MAEAVQFGIYEDCSNIKQEDKDASSSCIFTSSARRRDCYKQNLFRTSSTELVCQYFILSLEILNTDTTTFT